MAIPMRIKTLEKLDSDYGMYTWPCAPLLGRLVLSRKDEINGKRIIELSAGTAIPGLIAAKCGGIVTLTDREDNPHLLKQLKDACSLNHIEDVNIMGLTWGVFSPGLLELEPQDFILASDCFYDSKDFEDILVNVSYLMEKNENCKFWTSYQERSSNRTLVHLLDRWNLNCQVISTETISQSDDIIIEGPSPNTLSNGWSLHLWEITKRKSATL